MRREDMKIANFSRLSGNDNLTDGVNTRSVKRAKYLIEIGAHPPPLSVRSLR